MREEVRKGEEVRERKGERRGKGEGWAGPGRLEREGEGNGGRERVVYSLWFTNESHFEEAFPGLHVCYRSHVLISQREIIELKVNEPYR